MAFSMIAARVGRTWIDATTVETIAEFIGWAIFVVLAYWLIIDDCKSENVSSSPHTHPILDINDQCTHLVDSPHSRCLDILPHNYNRYRGLYLHRQHFVRMDYVHRMDDDNHRQCTSRLVNNPRFVCISLCIFFVYVDMVVCFVHNDILHSVMTGGGDRWEVFVCVYNIKKDRCFVIFGCSDIYKFLKLKNRNEIMEKLCV